MSRSTSRSPRPVAVSDGVVLGGDHPPVFVAGPCVIESEAHCLAMARAVAAAAGEAGVAAIFKASFDKANRTSIAAFRGPGLEDGLAILKKVKEETGLAVLTDVHDPSQVAPAADVVDVLQIPALLCRQTDLLLAAGRSGRTINIKKGQFLAPADVAHAAAKVASTGNKNILLTERGASFGYNNLVVDMRSLVILRETGYPVIFDATHSVQLPGGGGDHSAGQPRFIETLSRAAAAVGIDGLFTEVHDQPEAALSDGANALPLPDLRPLMNLITDLSRFVGERRRASS